MFVSGVLVCLATLLNICDDCDLEKYTISSMACKTLACQTSLSFCSVLNQTAVSLLMWTLLTLCIAVLISDPY